jgi:hypothetical protein
LDDLKVCALTPGGPRQQNSDPLGSHYQNRATSMKTSRSRLMEGVTILVSILIAFAIDAAWDSAQGRARIDRDLMALRVDTETNVFRLKESVAEGGRSIGAARELVAAIGPATPVLSEDSIQSLFGASFSYGAAQLELASTNKLLESAEFAGLGSADLFRTLTDLRASYDAYQSDGDLFIRLREDVIAYMLTVTPAAFVSAGTNAHEPTDFPVSVEALLRDQRLEGLVGNLAVRIRNLNRNASELAAVLDSVHALVGSSE